MIALVQSATAFGAVERYGAALLAGLRERGNEAVLLMPNAPALEPFEREAGGSVALERFPADLFGRTGLAQTRELASRLRRLQPAAVHVLDVWPSAMLAARLARTDRLLVTHHTPELPRNDSAAGRLWWRAGWLTRPEIIYTSETDRRTDGMRPRSQAIPLGIELGRYVDPEPALPWPGPQIGTVARLVPQKGHDVLLEAARTVIDHHPDARFVIVGEGELHDALAARAASLGEAVLFTGARDDVPELLASFDVFALPSRFEGLCLAVIEAQAAGVPVVATAVGGIRETVVPGETGTTVPVDDPAALAAAIEQVLDDPEWARRQAAEARTRVRERFSLEAMVAATIEAYA